MGTLRGGSNEYPQSMFLSKDIENIKKNSDENFQFLTLKKKSLYIEWASFHNIYM